MGVRIPCLQVKTPSSLLWCRLGPSAPSSSPQQNLKLDGLRRWTPAGWEDSLSKQTWICSAVSEETRTSQLVWVHTNVFTCLTHCPSHPELKSDSTPNCDVTVYQSTPVHHCSQVRSETTAGFQELSGSLKG